MHEAVTKRCFNLFNMSQMPSEIKLVYNLHQLEGSVTKISI